MGRLTIEDYHKLAETKGGKFISDKVTNARTKVIWQCIEKGHKFESTYDNIKRTKHFCPVCRPNAPKTLEDCKVFAQTRGALCLSNKYQSSKKKMIWQCADGHTFESTWDSYSRAEKSGCSQCEGNARLSLEEAREIALKNNGECLSTDYVNNRTPMEWRCARGHIWTTTLDSIKRVHWCQACNNGTKTIEECKEFAESKGGRCLSTHYVDTSQHLLWECHKGHQWYASFGNINRSTGGSWCPECWKCDINDCIEIAKGRNGECLTTEYIDRYTKMKFKCCKGHEFTSTLDILKKGSWCPRCNESKGERLVTNYLESRGFPYIPQWTLPTTRLRCDFYLPEHNVIIEYDGCLHFEISYYSKTEEKLKEIQERDLRKNEVAKTLGYKMIRIGYTHTDIEDFLKHNLHTSERFVVSCETLYAHHLSDVNE